MDFGKESASLDELISDGKLNKANRKVLGSVLKQVEGGAVPEAAYITTRDSLLAIPVHARGETHGSELLAALERDGDKKTADAIRKVGKLADQIAEVAKRYDKVFRVVINAVPVKAETAE